MTSEFAIEKGPENNVSPTRGEAGTGKKGATLWDVDWEEAPQLTALAA